MTRSVLPVCCALLVAQISFAQTPASSSPAADSRPPSSSAALAHSLNAAFGDVYEKASPAVVVIEAEQNARTVANSPLLRFFQDEEGNIPSIPGEMNQGSGFIITSDGYILTNNHVIDGAAGGTLRVTLKDGRQFPGKVIGLDKDSDLAVVKIDAPKLPVMELGDSDKARVGEFAFAIGAPFDLRYSFTYGVISAKGRTNLTGGRNYEEFIQTDASINPGNSGGPLVDIDGRAIGVNTLINGINRGLGFAVPINMAKKIAMQLIADGRVSRPWLGIEMTSVRDRFPEVLEKYPNLPGDVLVTGIGYGTPASRSGLRVWDIIASVDGKSIKSPSDLQKTILDKKVGEEVELQVWRDERMVKVKLRTAERQDGGYIPAANQRIAPPQRGVPQAPVQTANGGLNVVTITPRMARVRGLSADRGVLVTGVQPGSPAETAGIQPGDIITEIGSVEISSTQDFLQALSEAPGDAVMLNIDRNGEAAYGILKLE